MRQKYLTTKEVAEYLTRLGISIKPQTLRLWRMRGKFDIPVMNISNKHHFHIDDVDRWIETFKEKRS